MERYDFQNIISQPQQEKHTVSCVVNVIVLCLIMAVASVSLLFLKRPDISATEKRELAKFPEFSWISYYEGDYTDAI
ncbi:MAG: hypothetical protein WC900_10570, partial [Oscillospiraceae bacterium]